MCECVAENVLVKTKLLFNVMLSEECVLYHQNNKVPGSSKYLIVSVISASILSNSTFF